MSDGSHDDTQKIENCCVIHTHAHAQSMTVYFERKSIPSLYTLLMLATYMQYTLSNAAKVNFLKLARIIGQEVKVM